MDQATNESKRGAGGDTRTPQAKQEIARREQQIVALRLRHHSFAAIGRVVGMFKQNARRLSIERSGATPTRTFQLIIGANSPSWTLKRVLHGSWWTPRTARRRARRVSRP